MFFSNIIYIISKHTNRRRDCKRMKKYILKNILAGHDDVKVTFKTSAIRTFIYYRYDGYAVFHNGALHPMAHLPYVDDRYDYSLSATIYKYKWLTKDHLVVWQR